MLKIKKLHHLYRPLTKLWKGTVFIHVCLFTRGGGVGLYHRDPPPRLRTPNRDPWIETPGTETLQTVHLMAATEAGGTHPIKF